MISKICQSSIIFLIGLWIGTFSAVSNASSINYERKISQKTVDGLGSFTDDSFSNSLTIRIDDVTDKAFLKNIEFKYSGENFDDSLNNDLSRIRQFSISSLITRGNISKTITTIGFGLASMEYSLLDEPETYLGIRVPASIVFPLSGTRLFTKIGIEFDLLFREANGTEDEGFIYGGRGELALIYSFPRFDISAAYVYRAHEIDDTLTEITRDTASGPAFSARLRF